MVFAAIPDCTPEAGTEYPAEEHDARTKLPEDGAQSVVVIAGNSGGREDQPQALKRGRFRGLNGTTEVATFPFACKQDPAPFSRR
jgi:hypothetical protein